MFSYRDTEPTSWRLPLVPSPSHLHCPGFICEPDKPFNFWRTPWSSGPLFSSQHSHPIFGFKVKSWSHNVNSHIKYGVRSLKPQQYTTMSQNGVNVRPTSQTPETMRRWLASPWIARSSAGTPESASIAPVRVVCITPVIPKHGSLCTLLSVFLALAVWQPGPHTKDAKQVDSQMIETYSQWATLGLRPSYRPTTNCEPFSPLHPSRS